MCDFLFLVLGVDLWSSYWLRSGFVVWSVYLAFGEWVVISRLYPRSSVPGAGS